MQLSWQLGDSTMLCVNNWCVGREIGMAQFKCKLSSNKSNIFRITLWAFDLRLERFSASTSLAETTNTHILAYPSMFVFSFQLLGLGILIPGILMLADVKLVNDEVLPLLQQLGFGGLNVGDLAKGLSVTLIIFGTFVLIVSLFGCCGAFCQQRICLVVVSWLEQSLVILP